MKRNLDEYEEPLPSTTVNDKRSKVYGEVPLSDVTMTIRILINTKDSGQVIGKQGANIRKVRETSGAEVKLADAPHNSSRRAASCSGSPAQVSSALIGIMELLHTHNPELGEAPPDTQPAITLLVGNEVVGACIGKGGNVINHTRESTGALIKISEKPLDGSTEKTVDVRGTTQVVAMAIDMIVKQVATMAEKPTGAVPLTRIEWGSPAALANAFATPAYEPSSYSGMGGGYGGSYGSGYGGGGGYAPGYPPPPGFGGEKRQVVIPVANGLVGSLIGKGGNVIQRIRDASRAEIKIADPAPGSEQRNVTITGNEVCTQTAVSMVYEALGQPSPYGPPQSGAPPPGYYGAGGYY